MTDLSFRFSPTQASGNVVIVEIDRQSLDQLGASPWPRELHAKALDQLSAAGAHKIAFDIDFSGRINAKDDQALADAIGRAGGRVILPVFTRSNASSADNNQPIISSPYAPLTLGAKLGTVNVRPEKDGSARRYRSSDSWNGKTIPSLASLLANNRTQRGGSFFLDFGIQAKSIPQYSFSDILNGNFHPLAFKGKSVIVGAMTNKLGDQLPVPVYGVLAGPMVHALAFESLIQKRNVYGRTALFIIGVAFLISFFALWFLIGHPMRTGKQPDGV